MQKFNFFPILIFVSFTILSTACDEATSADAGGLSQESDDTEDTDDTDEANKTDASEDNASEETDDEHMDDMTDGEDSDEDESGVAVDDDEGENTDVGEASECRAENQAGSVGDRIQSLTLPTCDGTLFSIDSQCGVLATDLILFTGWCPNCRDTIQNQTPDRIERFSASGYEPILVITEDNSGDAPDAAFCETVRRTYGVDYPVLYDAEGLFRERLGTGAGNDTNFILDQELTIRFRAQYPNDAELNAAIAELVEPVES